MEYDISLITALFYLMAGIGILYLFRKRRKAVALMHHSQLPELSESDFSDLKILLKTAYERMLYLGVLFFPLAYSTFHGGDKISSIFFLLLIALLFISNIVPRHKIIKLLKKNNLSIIDLKQKRIKL